MISGILLIDKPAGITSFEVVRRARRALKLRKIGHLGTLDPFATGLLPLCLGEATKLAPYLLPGRKSYRATLRLGEATDTQDLTGRVLSRTETLPEPEEVRRLAATLVGEISQVPPMHSALHYKGERLYRLARRGERVELPPRAVTIYRLEVEQVELPRVTFTVQCSQGTYIRTLAADLGAALGCGAHLEALRRLQVGAFRVEAALKLATLEEAEAEALLARIIPLSSCLPGVRQVAVNPGEAAKLRQGREISPAGRKLASGGVGANPGRRPVAGLGQGTAPGRRGGIGAHPGVCRLPGGSRRGSGRGKDLGGRDRGRRQEKFIR